jgi:hypothetical protein
MGILKDKLEKQSHQTRNLDCVGQVGALKGK